MKITSIKVTVINVAFIAPIRWSGGANADWTRLVIEMETDDGLVGLGETLGGNTTKTLIDSEIAPMFMGEDPFDLERILSKATFVPLYYGKAGNCAVAGLELACWDIMGKAVGRPLYQLLGGRLREEIPFAGYIYHRNPDREGRNAIDGLDDVLERARELSDRWGFTTLKYKGGVTTPEEELEVLRALRENFPAARLRYDPQAIFSASTSIRLAKQCEPLDLEYLEDPCWGLDAMARVNRKTSVPLATNMCVIDLDTMALGVRLGSVDVVLGDIFEWGGISKIKKLQGACDIFQINLAFHSAAELGIGTAAYLHLAASVPALPHALDTHVLELADDVVVPGPIALTERGTMRVPDGPGLGVELDRDKLMELAEAHRRLGDQSVYGEDVSRNGVIPVKSMF